MILGIDIGGSKIRGILWDGKKIRKSWEFRTPKTLKGFEKVITELIHNSSSASWRTPSSYSKRRGRGGGVNKIGIGIAGVVVGTKIISATNISYFKNYDFKTLFSNLHFPILNLKIDNDARTFAQAEYNFGAGKGYKSALFITLGTGVGRAYGIQKLTRSVFEGKILKIKKFEKAESWEKDYQKIKNKNILTKFLSENLIPIIHVLGADVIVLGGGVIEKKGYFEAIKKQLSSDGTVGAKLDIRRSKLGKFAGAIGAAMLWK